FFTFVAQNSSAKPVNFIEVRSGNGWINKTLKEGDFSAHSTDVKGNGRIDRVEVQYRGKSDLWYFVFDTTKLGTEISPGFYNNLQYAFNPAEGHAGIYV